MPMITTFIKNQQTQNTGFSLIEVLVSMVVLSIGLLGLAGMQANGLKSNHSAYLKTQATTMAGDMMDRIRANMEGVRTGSYNSISLSPNTSNPYSDPACLSSGCSAAQLAQYDAYDWGEALASILPSGSGRVTGAGDGSMFTITVMWDNARTGATGTACGNDESIDLKCFTTRSQP